MNWYMGSEYWGSRPASTSSNPVKREPSSNTALSTMLTPSTEATPLPSRVTRMSMDTSSWGRYVSFSGVISMSRSPVFWTPMTATSRAMLKFRSTLYTRTEVRRPKSEVTGRSRVVLVAFMEMWPEAMVKPSATTS